MANSYLGVVLETLRNVGLLGGLGPGSSSFSPFSSPFWS
jgi:hypothetical protein